MRPANRGGSDILSVEHVEPGTLSVRPFRPRTLSYMHPTLNPMSPFKTALLLSMLGVLPVLRAEEPLKIVFTDAEYRAAGLGKLSAEEQAALMQALRARGLGVQPAQPVPAASRATAAAPARAGEAVAPAQAAAPAPAPERKGLWARIKDFGAEQLPLKSNKDEGEVTEVEAQMIEPFHGLQGHTLFRLDNGQVWQQRIPETYFIGKPIDNPKVILKRTRFGYRLFIPAVGPSFDVSVKRVM